MIEIIYCFNMRYLLRPSALGFTTLIIQYQLSCQNILELKNKNTDIIKHAHDKKLFDICKYYRKNQSDQTKQQIKTKC